MVQDVPRHLLPDGACWDTTDTFLDQDGKLTKRGGTKAIVAATTKQFDRIASLVSASEDALSRMIVAHAASFGWNAFDPSVGTLSATNGTFNLIGGGFGQMTNHGNLVAMAMKPVATGTNPPYVLWGGSVPFWPAYGNGAVSPVATAGSRTITGLIAADTTAATLGSFLYFANATNIYVGRITAIPNATTLRVEPTPTVTFTGTNLNIFATMNASGQINTGGVTGVTALCSFQNRLVMGNTSIGRGGGNVEMAPNRLVWTALSTETITVPVGVTSTGYANLTYPDTYLNNYVDLPAIRSIVALVPIGEGQLLILGDNKALRLTGQLTTQSVAGGSISFDVHEIPNSVGCLSERSVQQTPLGAVFASRDGIYLYDGARMANIMEGRISRYWGTQLAAGMTIYGSAVLPGPSYYISTSSGGFLCNLVGHRYTRITNVDISGAVNDLSNPSRVFAVKNAAGSASTTDKIQRIDTMLFPSSTATTDAGGAAVTTMIQTREYTEGDPAALKRFRHTLVSVELVGGAGTVTITATPGLEGESAAVTLGTVSPLAGPQELRYDHGILSRSIAYTFQQAGASNSFDLLQIDTAYNVLREGRTV